MAEYLTRGAIAKIKQGDNISANLQIIAIKGLNSDQSPAPQRYRFQLTDGVDKISAMPATQLNKEVMEGKVKNFSIIKLLSYQTSTVADQMLIILLGMDLVAHAATDLSGGSTLPTSAPPQQAYPQTNQNPSVSVYQPSYGTNPTAAYPVQGAAPAYGSTANNYSAAPVAKQPQQMYNQPPQVPSMYNQPPQTVPMYNQAPVPQSYGSSYQNPSNPYAAKSAVVKDDNAGVNIVPISAINPYSSKWTIKARITSKSEMKRWSNARGEGVLFSIDLLDGAGGEIRGTFFKDAAEKFFGILEEGKVYTFSGGTLKVVQNRQYTTIKNPYEVTFNSNSDIRPAQEDTAIKSQTYNFVKIDQIANTEPNTTIDVLAVVRGASEVSEIISNKQGGKTLHKRDLTLTDDSGGEIKLTLWDQKAQQYGNDFWGNCPVVAFKNVRVGDFGGRSLSASNSTSISVNPPIQEGSMLFQWKMKFPNGIVPSGNSLSVSGGAGTAGGFDSFEKRKLIASIKDEGLGTQEKPDYITVKGTVIYIKHDNEPFYTACPTPGCNKKVVEGMSGEYSCEKCNRQFPSCIRRYVLSISAADHTGSTWFSLFNETAEKLLKKTAQELYELKAQGNEAAYEKVFQDALFKPFIAKVRVKQEQVQDEMRVKNSFMKVEDLDFVDESRNLLEAINKYQ